MNYLTSIPLEIIRKHTVNMIPDDFGFQGELKLIRLNSLNIRSRIWRRSSKISKAFGKLEDNVLIYELRYNELCEKLLHILT